MKILCAGDLHARERAPRNRVDNFYMTMIGKLHWILATARKVAADVVVFPGDVFDSFRASDSLKRVLILHFMGTDVFCVAGQHDQRRHTQDLSNPPLGVLEASGVVRILNQRPEVLSRCAFYGASWGEEVPRIEHGDYFNVLAIHRMIIKGRQLWPGQEGYIAAKNLLRRTGFDLIVSGDNHQFFQEELDGRRLVNCGSVMRQSIDQWDHEPAVVVVDTGGDGSVEAIPIPIVPSERVFDLARSSEEKAKSEDLERYVDALADVSEHEDLNFVRFLTSYMVANGVEGPVQEVIREAMR